MNRTFINFFVVLICLFPIEVQAEDNKFEQLLEQINQVENELSKDNKELIEKVERIEKRLSEFSTKIADIHAIKKSVEDKYNDILKKEALSQKLSDDVQMNKTSIASLNTKSQNIEKNQVRIEGDINSSQEIVTWVTLIVTVVIVLIGLFFSKLFLDLYSNYKVLRSHIPKENLLNNVENN